MSITWTAVSSNSTGNSLVSWWSVLQCSRPTEQCKINWWGRCYSETSFVNLKVLKGFLIWVFLLNANKVNKSWLQRLQQLLLLVEMSTRFSFLYIYIHIKTGRLGTPIHKHGLHPRQLSRGRNLELIILLLIRNWENKKCYGNTSSKRVFPVLFRVLPNFH